MVVFAGNQMMSLVDTIIVGHLGAVELAAVGLGSSLYIVIAIFGIGLVTALDPLASQAIGGGDPVAAKRHFLHTTRLCVILTLPLSALILLLFLPMGLFIDDPELLHEALYYTLGRLPGLLPFLLFIAHRSYLQSLGTTRAAMVAVLTANVLNVPASLLLAYGDGVFEYLFGLPVGLGPGLGPLGVGIATSIVGTWEFLYMRKALRKLPDPGPIGPIGWTGMRKVGRVGFPVGIHLVAEVGVFAAASVIIGSISTLSLAAHQVAIQLASVTFTIALGVSSATATRVGFAVGREKLEETRRAGWVGLVTGSSVMACSALVFLFFADALASIMCTGVVIAAAVPLIHIAAMFQVSDGVQIVAAGALRGAGETRKPMVANLVGHWLFGLPVGLLLAYRVLTDSDIAQTSGLWWGLTAGLTVVAIWLTTTFYRLTRTQVKRVDDES